MRLPGSILMVVLLTAATSPDPLDPDIIVTTDPFVAEGLAGAPAG